jgi:hypothetical protein
VAREFGRLDVDAMLEELPARRFDEWARFCAEDPRLERLERQVAVVALTVYRMFAGRGSRRLRVDDFLAVQRRRPRVGDGLEELGAEIKRRAGDGTRS